MELTLFALDALESGSRSPFALWVSQWQRDDPMHHLHEKGVRYDESAKIEECVSELSSMLPEAEPLKLNAAVDLRLRRLNALKNLYNVQHVPELDKWYSLLISRAVEVGDGMAACIPMFDMINHNSEPNLGLAFDGSHFELFACRDIQENEELFICYTRDLTEEEKMEGDSDGGGTWSEVTAIWTLVQWGAVGNLKSLHHHHHRNLHHRRHKRT